MTSSSSSECGNLKKEGGRSWRCQLPRYHGGDWHINHSGHRRWPTSKDRKAEESQEVPPPSYLPRVILDGDDLRTVVKAYQDWDYFVFDTETIGSREPRPGAGKKDAPALDERTNTVFWMALAVPGRLDVIPIGHPSIEGYPAPAQLSRAEVLTELRPLFFSNRRKVAANVIFDTLSLAKYWGDIPPGPYGDLAVLDFQLNENSMEYDLGSIVSRRLGYGYRKLGREGQMDSFPFWDVARYVGLDAKLTQLVWDKLSDALLRYPEIERIFAMECDVTEVLIHAKSRGALVNREALEELDAYLTAEMARLTKLVHDAAGREFLITSVPQKQTLLYGPKVDPEGNPTGNLGLKCVEFTDKGGQSTSDKALQALRAKHQVVPLLIEYGDVQKLKSTYANGMLPHIQADGRIRGRLNQRGAVTGRFTSSGPNLQNQPRQSGEDDTSKKIRSMFVAPPGYVLVVGDFSQVEYRVMAHFAGPLVKDSRMLRAFREGVDLHAVTAAGIYRVDPDKLSKEQRQSGKTANFLLMFGGSPQRLVEAGLARNLTQGKRIFENFHRIYPENQRFRDKTIADARALPRPYVTTLWGRRRRLPGLRLPRTTEETRKLRGYAERQAVNHVIQGSAADFNKAAMVRAFRRIQCSDLAGRAHIILTVHDEIIIECPEDRAEEGVVLLKESMEGVKHGMLVPLVADVHAGKTWADAK